MNISHRTLYHGIDDRMVPNITNGAKMNNEISSAIKRQRETSGVDYLKPSPIKVPAQTDRKGFSNKIQNISFDGAVLPQFTISSQLKTDRGQTKNSRKTNKFGTLSRSKTSVSLSLPSRQGYTHQTTPHNVVLTDLTCLQLADTLFSSNLAFGLPGQSADRLKYTTFVGDRPTPLSGENEKDQSVLSRNGASFPYLNGRTDNNYLQRRSVNESSIYSRRGSMRPNSANNTKGLCLHLSHHQQKDSPKSILKQNFVDTQTDAAGKKTKYRTVSERNSRRHSHPDQSKFITIKATKIGLQSAHGPTINNRLFSVGDKDKRSVRFNVAHEVIEYAPHDPVCT